MHDTLVFLVDPNIREEILHIIKTQIPSLVLYEGKYCVLARAMKAAR